MNSYLEAYERLEKHYGRQGNWWPSDNYFDVVIGAVLTQNTNWKNVEKTLAQLRDNDLLSYDKLSSLPLEELSYSIKSTGFYNVKAKRLQALFEMIKDVYQDDIEMLLKDDLQSSRDNLLAVKGIGAETADSILLYAGDQPTFVIDTYTHRVFSRHGMVDEETDYYSMQETFISNLPEDVLLYKGFHGLIVNVAKEFCKKKRAGCISCPLNGLNDKCYENYELDEFGF